MAIDGALGATVIDVSVGAELLTVMAEVAVRPEAVFVAVIVAVPLATAVTRPPALTVATPVADDAKVDADVRSAVVESEYVPVTVSCRVAATASVAVAGVTAMESSVGRVALTFTVAEAIFPDAVWVAVTMALPPATAVTSPVSLTVAAPRLEETKVEPAVRLTVVSSE